MRLAIHQNCAPEKSCRHRWHPPAASNWPESRHTCQRVAALATRPIPADEDGLTVSNRNGRCTCRGAPAHRRCAGAGPHTYVSPYGGTLTVDNWRALFTLSAQRDGDYVISCSGPVSDARFGVGDHISAGEIAYPFTGAGAGVPFIIAGIVVLIVTFVRRGRCVVGPTG